jgi:hypothetical protein
MPRRMPRRGGGSFLRMRWYNDSMADSADRPLGPEPQFKALLKRLIDTPKSALDKLEAERQKRPSRKKPA